MTGTNKTVAERLREMPDNRKLDCYMAKDIVGFNCDSEILCSDCYDRTAKAIADMIEAEQAELRKKLDFNLDSFMRERDCLCRHIEELESQSVDVAALDLLCGKLECGSPNYQDIAKQIRKARGGVPDWSDLKGIFSDKNRQLPKDIKWPRFDDGHLVKFGDEFVDRSGCVSELSSLHFYDDEVQLNLTDFLKYGEPVKRPEPEILDADSVPIKVGDTVYWTRGGNAKTVKSIVDGFVEVEDGIERLFPEQLTHQAPVLDADGVPIKVGETVWYTDEICAKKYVGNECEFITLRNHQNEIVLLNLNHGYEQHIPLKDSFTLTHRKPDTKESVRAEIIEAVKADYAVNLLPLFERYDQAVLREAGE